MSGSMGIGVIAMAVREIARIELVVTEDPARWTAPLALRGFRRAFSRDTGGVRQVMMARGRARVLVTEDRSGRAESSPSRGPVIDVAFVVDDVVADYRRVLAAGARAISAPTAWLRQRPGLTAARVGAGGGIRHTLCGHAAHADGPDRAESGNFAVASVGLLAGDSAAAARLYVSGLGFHADGRELRSGGAVVTLANPAALSCRPRPGSAAWLAFGRGEDATLMPVCHPQCVLVASVPGGGAALTR
jgi:hypothetical protein